VVVGECPGTVEMREQSQKNEMAAALKGDFERLRRRGVSSTLGASEEPAEPGSVIAAERPSETPDVPAPGATVCVEPLAAAAARDVGDSDTAAAPASNPEPTIATASEHGAADDFRQTEVDPVRRSVWGRLIGRG
jgi:hypothetical protein